jgi:predicted MFS family arabinose efflux permease
MPKFSCKPVSSWGVVAISFVNIALAYGLNFSFSVFFVAILEEFKWSRASIAGAFSLSSLILGIGSWLGGLLYDLTGSYRIPFFLCIPVLVLACILFWVAGSAKEKR